VLFRSQDPNLSIPPYWVRPPQRLSGETGFHRFLWDFHYAPVPGIEPEYPISAVYRNTPPEATSPWAMPGRYTVVLTVNGKPYQQPLTIKMDPRVKTPIADLAMQFKQSKQLYDEWLALNAIGDTVKRVRARLAELKPKTAASLQNDLNTLSENLESFAGSGGGGRGATPVVSTVASVTDRLRTLFRIIEGVDVRPTPQITRAVPEVINDSHALQQTWQTTRKRIDALNVQLRSAGLQTIDVEQ